MPLVSTFLNWLRGGEHHYQTLAQCAGGDSSWLTVHGVADTIDACVCFGIMVAWVRKARRVEAIAMRRSIFIFVGLFACMTLSNFVLPVIALAVPMIRVRTIFDVSLIFLTAWYCTTLSKDQTSLDALEREVAAHKNMAAASQRMMARLSEIDAKAALIFNPAEPL